MVLGGLDSISLDLLHMYNYLEFVELYVSSLNTREILRITEFQADFPINGKR